MSKRRTDDSDDRYFDSGDSPIGLTGAFAPVKGPQSVDYSDIDDPVGLTQAFGAIPDEDEPRVWDEEGKWDGFDWDAGYEAGDGAADGTADETPDAEPASEPADAPVGEDAAGADVAEDDQVADRKQPVDAAGAKSGRGRHAAPDLELTPKMQKSRRTRKFLIVLIILLVLLAAVGAYFAYKVFSESQADSAAQAEQLQQADTSGQDVIENPGASESAEAPAAKTDVPSLTSLFGKTSDEAIAAIGHGALVTSNKPVDDKASAIKTNLNVALTDEPADSKTGTPTVYLGLDKEGKVIQVGYSASAGALGFGTLSFADAVNVEHVIEKTLGKVGVDVPEGSAVLPADKAAYSTYASDKTTVVKERCSFDGPIQVDGVDCTWSAVLSYDYATQVVTGNLNDTVRIIYAYVSMNVEPDPEPEGGQPAEGGEQPAQ